MDKVTAQRMNSMENALSSRKDKKGMRAKIGTYAPCQNCSKLFYKTPSRNRYKYCSALCARPHINAALRKAGEQTRYKTGSIPWSTQNKGRYSLSFSDPIARANKIRVAKIGLKSHFWKGGLYKLNKRSYSRWYDLRKKKVGGRHTEIEWQALKERLHNMCLCCKLTEPNITLTRDHIIPITRGGTDDISNIQPLCQSCNSRKYTSIIDFNYNVSLI